MSNASRLRARSRLRGRLASLLAGLACACGVSPASEEPAPSDAAAISPATSADDALPRFDSALPKPRLGGALIGRRLDPQDFSRWIASDAREDEAPALEAVLLRWWTDGCPFCEASLPAIERLRRDYAALGLEVVAVYHPKSPIGLTDDELAPAARERGFHGRVAVDRDWGALGRAWPDDVERDATSVTILADPTGRVLFVHPGPELHPADPERSGAEHARCEADFADLERAVRIALGLEVRPR